MANIDEINDGGIVTKDNLTLVEDLTTAWQNTYSQNGETLNLDSNTPDGQIIQILAEIGTVIREMITEVYNSCDPDKCVGSIQDNRYLINYLTRKAGAYALQNIDITANKTVKLQGLDAMYNEPEAAAYAVSDDNGNIWYLKNSTSIGAGTTTLEFRAKEKGDIIPVIGTITNQVTIVEGITGVINSSGLTDHGYEEESDSDFRIRRAMSTATRGENNADTIQANLLNLDGVIEARVYQNNTNSTDTNGIPAHSIWAIVVGGADDKIAETIYANLGGAGTKGAKQETVYSSALQPITINFDGANVVNLYIKFDLQTDNLAEINQDDVKEYIATNLTYQIGEDGETSKVGEICADAMIADGGNGYALNPKISLNGTDWYDYIQVSSLADKLTPAESRITINVLP